MEAQEMNIAKVLKELSACVERQELEIEGLQRQIDSLKREIKEKERKIEEQSEWAIGKRLY